MILKKIQISHKSAALSIMISVGLMDWERRAGAIGRVII